MPEEDDLSYPLGKPIRPEPAPVDLDAYKPIPGRPGWLINGRGQMARDQGHRTVWYFGVPITIPPSP